MILGGIWHKSVELYGISQELLTFDLCKPRWSLKFSTVVYWSAVLKATMLLVCRDYRLCCCDRISTSNVSGSSADDTGSCDDRDPNGLDFVVSQSHCSFLTTASVASSSLPSPSLAFRCISSNDSVESRPASECSVATAPHDDAVELPSGACDHLTLL